MILYILVLALVFVIALLSWVEFKNVDEQHRRYMMILHRIQEVLSADEKLNRHVSDVLDNNEEIIKISRELIFHLKKNGSEDDGK